MVYFNLDIKTNFTTSQTVDLEKCSIVFFIKEPGTSFHSTSCAWLFKKNISHVTFYYLTKFHRMVPLLVEMLRNICIALICFPGCDVINFEINLCTKQKSQEELFKIVFLKISQNSKRNTFTRVSFLIKLPNFKKISLMFLKQQMLF